MAKIYWKTIKHRARMFAGYTANFREKTKAVIVEEVKQDSVSMKECIKYTGEEYVVAK